MKENTYLDFNNPIHIIWRSGSAEDPYVDRLDITKVVNQRLVLLEIPDELYRARIANMLEINYERYIKHNLEPNEFYVDYSNGFIYFHHSKEAQTISVVYKGRGFLLYPASRIVSSDGTNPAESLQDMLTNIDIQIKLLIDETQNFEEVMKNMVIATNLTREATDGALVATQEAKDATELVNDAYKTTVLIYKDFVQTEAEIKIKYPFPEVGWTVQVYESGIRYRWNGQDWVPIDALGGNIPLANEQIDGLMSKEQYAFVKSINKEVNMRVMFFSIPQDILVGVQIPVFKYPFIAGKITKIEAYVNQGSDEVTAINLEKNLNNTGWISVTNPPIRIQPNMLDDDGAYGIVEEYAVQGEKYRLNVALPSGVRDLTVNVEFETIE